MKKFRKEILILLIQVFFFYVFPIFAGPTDAMGMVYVLILATFVLGYFFSLISRWEWKWCWPGVVALLFSPSIFLYYNFTAYIHIVWYLVISTVGMLFGLLIRKLFRMQ